MLKYNPHLFRLMQGLLYPAVLGTFFVLFIGDVKILVCQPETFLQLNFLYSIVLLIYFCASFLINENLERFNCYNSVNFILDFIEIILMFICFSHLNIDGGFSDDYSINYFYLTAACIPLVQLIWNIYIGESARTYIILNITASSLLFVAGIWLFQYIIINYLLLMSMIVLLGYYLYYLIKVDKDWKA